MIIQSETRSTRHAEDLTNYARYTYGATREQFVLVIPGGQAVTSFADRGAPRTLKEGSV
jgi:hypothetical protein